MDKTIIFEIYKGRNTMYMCTKSLLADEADKNIEFPAIRCTTLMNELSYKYNNEKNIGVLFSYCG